MTSKASRSKTEVASSKHPIEVLVRVPPDFARQGVHARGAPGVALDVVRQRREGRRPADHPQPVPSVLLVGSVAVGDARRETRHPPEEDGGHPSGEKHTSRSGLAG
jgi:hypothetical protein